VNTIQKSAIVNEHLKQADPLFKQGAGRDRYSGIRNILSTYSEGFNRKFFTAQQYEIKFMPSEKSLNEFTTTSVLG
jgi:hypothetical protein